MCNRYGIIPKRGDEGLAEQVNEVAANLVFTYCVSNTSGPRSSTQQSIWVTTSL